jgi:L-alanine-DL-glutamate epimerase-like enolase superfamily enzyme
VKVTAIETLACDAGWRNYHFVKLTTSDGIVGWSEFSEDFGSPGISAVIARLTGKVIGQRVSDHERIYAELYAATRPAAGGVVAQAMAAIENALIDAKAKALGVPVYALLGGKLRDYRPGFGSPYYPELNIDKTVLTNLHMHLEALRDGLGPDLGLLLDLNFNAKTEGYLKILRAIADIDMFWVEIDSYSPEALALIRRQSPHPISSCETLLTLREFLPYFREQAMDVAIIDTPWNGVWQSMKIAASAEAHEVNVAPHNFYGHLCTMMNAHFASAVPNLRIMEIDIDRLPWDDELFDTVPKIEHGHLVMPDTPGFGITPSEEALRAHPPKGEAGLLDYGRRPSS